MSHENQIEAVRLALTLRQQQASVASINIANAARPGAGAVRADFSAVENALRTAALAAGSAEDGHWLAEADRLLGRAGVQPVEGPVNLDEQVAEMSAVSTEFQALTEVLNRQFALMRLAVTGRS
ncbi:hypothetical protein [Arenimonas terrae]|uniref:Flagellar basal body rod protein FlgB n=1 Tax=Arenimonas terrae TaxID=2546226 RepID=A0A5C4RQA5_9GAMM|nr:hypothetical protein [Arenimonas terrae]TNJ33238.1 hypothetical protein E1B00_13145 [Arenimonas terrae]